MGFVSSLSLRAKILIVLTMVPMTTLTFFLFIAVGVFEADKIAYIFDSTSTVSRSLAAQVTSDINSAIVAAKPIVQDYLLADKFGPLSQSLLESESSIEEISIWGLENGQPQWLAQIDRPGVNNKETLEKEPAFKESLLEASTMQKAFRMPFGDDRALIVGKTENHAKAVFFAIVSKLASAADTASQPSSSGLFLVNSQGQILFGQKDGDESSVTNLGQKIDIGFLQKSASDRFKSGTQMTKGMDKEDWLVSFSKVSFNDLVVVSLVPKKEALKAMRVLIRKSVLYFVILLSAVIIVSLLVSGRLTKALGDLLAATKRVAEGHFDINVPVNSRDEIGTLAGSFNAMAAEVSRLLVNTAEKARMESELKTAQTVQETLFPPNEASLDGLRIAGFYEPASECGGDWWHYYEKGDFVYMFIGDATGHGAPAALITSAARSASSILERLDIGAAEALSLLNRAIYDVSKGRIMMTFILAAYNRRTRKLIYTNASHEAPFLIKGNNKEPKKKDLIPLNEINNPRLGQDRDTQYKAAEIDLEEGDRIFFYTDGLLDIQDKDKNSIGERNFIKLLVNFNQGLPPVHESIFKLRQYLADYRKTEPLIDDVTYFMIETEASASQF